MINITIYDKSRKLFRVYKNVTQVTYSDVANNHILSKEDLLSHEFQLGYDLHIFTSDGNYTVSQDLIGAIEVEKK